MLYRIRRAIVQVVSVHRCQSVAQPLDATVTLPGSKSMSNRALIAAALADGTSLLRNILVAEDTQLMLKALGDLGIAVTVDEADKVAEVTGCRGQLPASEARLFCGNSGTTMRFCTALAALGHGRYELDGIERMRQRPIGGLAAVLRVLGAGVEYLDREEYPPLAIHAKGLTGGQVAFRSPASSQFITGLLLVTPYAGRDVFIEITGEIPSVPYLKLTTALMDSFGVAVIQDYREGELRFIVGAPQRYQGTTLTIEPDASNATYFLAAAAIAGGRVTIERLGTDSTQGDIGFIDILKQMGCRVERASTQLTARGPTGGAPLRGIDVDLNHMPDTVPTLAVLALFADGPTVIRNVANLRLKETDRLAALRRELTKLGAGVDEFADGLTITPPVRLTPASIDTYNDHRMAMSFALAGLKCDGMVINNPDCTAKTFPEFFRLFKGITTGRA